MMYYKCAECGHKFFEANPPAKKCPMCKSVILNYRVGYCCECGGGIYQHDDYYVTKQWVFCKNCVEERTAEQ